MPPFNKEVQGNDFGFFKEEIVDCRHRVGGNHFWHQISCRFQGWKKRQRWRPPINDEIPTPPPEPAALSACHDMEHIAKICI